MGQVDQVLSKLAEVTAGAQKLAELLRVSSQDLTFKTLNILADLGQGLLAAPPMDRSALANDVWETQRQGIAELVRRGSGPVWINLGSGNLVLRLSHPGGGPFDPTPILTYNSLTPASSEFGYGWTAVPKQNLVVISSTAVDVTDGTGAVHHFINLDSNNRYQPPPTTNDSLVKNAEGTYTQTQADGFQIWYDTGGKVSRLANGAGSRWTVGYDSGNRITKITDPFSRRTTYVYDTNNKIRRAQDPAGRITSFSVNTTGDLSDFLRRRPIFSVMTVGGRHLLAATFKSQPS